LIVDDEEIVCRAIEELLRADGHEVEVTTSSAEAVELCKIRHFDLIFMDYYLAEISGEQMLAILRRLNPRQRIVIMSGQKACPLVAQADFFIRKPFSTEIIRKSIARFA
jgi:CheY-like chemotaxis protein